MATKTEVMKITATMAASYPNFKLKPETVEAYCEFLADVPYEQLRAAAAQCITESEFFPTIASLRKAAFAIGETPRRSGVEAWGDVLAEVKRVGSYGAPVFTDPIVARVVRGMGWTNICLSEDGMADRAHFIRAYEAADGRERESTRQLPAVKELSARLAGALGDPKRLLNGKVQ